MIYCDAEGGRRAVKIYVVRWNYTMPRVVLSLKFMLAREREGFPLVSSAIYTAWRRVRDHDR